MNTERLADLQNIVTQLNSSMENTIEQMSYKIELVNETFEKKLEVVCGNSTTLTNVADEIMQMKSKFVIIESTVNVLEMNRPLITNQKDINNTTNAVGQPFSSSYIIHVNISLENCRGIITSYANAIIKYPAHRAYANNLFCHWKVERPPGIVFAIQALSANIGVDDDYLSVLKSIPKLGWLKLQAFRDSKEVF